MQRNNILLQSAQWVAQLGIARRVPYRGTVGTLIGMGCWYLWKLFFPVSLVTLCSVSIIAYGVIALVLPRYNVKDPQEIILDELVGIWWALGSGSSTLLRLVVTFFIFRFFDGTKKCGVAWFEHLPGALGILSDDIAAGLLTYGVLQIMAYCSF